MQANLKDQSTSSSLSNQISVSNVVLLNNQFILTGSHLEQATNVKIRDGNNQTSLQIASQTSTQIIANTLNNITFSAGKIVNFVFTTANADATFAITFSLCNSTLGTKAINCTAVPIDKDVLSYDGNSNKWKPRAVGGLSYLGVWDATTAIPSIPANGEYYIVSVANVPDGYAVGDWIVSNGTTFEKINNSTTLTAVFGRHGNVVATKGDYSLTQMGNVDLTTNAPVTNNFLKFDGTNWVPGTVTGGGNGTVTSVSGTAPVTVATGTSTPVISMAAATNSVNGYLTSADWTIFNSKESPLTAGTNLQYYRGDKSWQTLNSLAVSENTNLYFTNARVLGVALAGFDNTLTGTISTSDTVLQAFGRTQNQINSLSTGGSNYLTKNGTDTITGTVIVASGAFLTLNYTPSAATDAITKGYVDSFGQWGSSSGNAYRATGSVGIGTTSPTTGTKLDITGTGNTGSSIIIPRDTVANRPTVGVNGMIRYASDTNKFEAYQNGSWTDMISTGAGGAPTGAAGGILTGTYPNPTITGLDSTIIGYLSGVSSNIQTQLNAKATSILTSTNIFVGNSSNVATAAALSGDATLSNTGVLTLKSTGTAGTYSSVTTDAEGRITAGTNPAIVTSVTATAPLTVGGTAAVPLVSMAAATAGVDGYLTAANFTTFNGKQDAISSGPTINGIVYPATGAQTLQVPLAPVALIDAVNKQYVDSFWTISSGNIYRTTGSVGIGTTSPTAGTKLDITGTGNTASSIIIPRDTTGNRPTVGVNGMIRYASDTNKFEAYQNGAWTDMISTSGTPTGAAGGILTGTYPNPTISGLDATIIGYLSGVSSNIQTQLNAKATSILTSTNIFVGNSSNVATAAAISGDATLSNTGVLTLKSTGTAGTYSSVTTDAEGRVTGGTNPIVVTSVTGTAPVTVGGTAAVPLISMAAATAAVNGYLTAANFTTFNGKQDALSSGPTINGIIYPATGAQTLKVPLAPVALTDAVNKQYVDNFGQWTSTSGNVYRTTGNVGIGTTIPTNNLSVTPSQYSTGTASQALTTVTGVGTTWTIQMIGSQLVFANGVSAGAITAFNSATSLTVAASQTVTSQAYSIKSTGLQVASTGKVGIGTDTPTSLLSLQQGNVDETEIGFRNPTTGTALTNGFVVGINRDTNGAYPYGLIAYIWNYSNAGIIFGTNNTQNMILDGSGQLGCRKTAKN